MSEGGWGEREKKRVLSLLYFDYSSGASGFVKKNKKKHTHRTVDISSNLCGITGVVWNP